MCNNHHNIGFAKHHKNHDQHHEQWSRRSFIQALGLAGSGTIMLGGKALAASSPSPLALALNQTENDRSLVLIRLKGGNDGLNTIIPLAQYNTYANNRNNIRITPDNYFNLSDEFAMPNFMNPLQSMWGDGKMKVLHGVGYPDQDLSHFRSSDIWATAEETEEISTGWMGRYFEELYPDYLTTPPERPAAIQIGSVGNLIFEGAENNYAFTVANPSQLESIANTGTVYDLDSLPDCTYGEQLRYMRGITNTTYLYAGVINDAYSATANDVEYDDNYFASQLAIVARLIKGNLGTKIFMVTIDGFDTHANQEDEHQRLMSRVSKGVSDFFADLASSGFDDKVIAMTISEFGRRVEQNGSLGTDHGSCAPMMLFGPALNGSGFLGEHPSLTDLDNDGNMKFSIDFREAYASILKDWLCVDAQFIDTALLDKPIEALETGISCSGALGNDDFFLNRQLDHFATYQDNQVDINLVMTGSARIVVRLYNIIGQDVGLLMDEFKTEGTHKINVKSAANKRLAKGQYIYRISTGGQNYSRSILIP